MYSTEQRRAAIETFIKFDHSYADTIAELGYPNRHTLGNWWREYEATGEVPVAKIVREPRFTEEQKREAVDHYLSHGRRLGRTMRALGYPRSRMTLCGWIDELAPGQRRSRGPNPKRDPVPVEKKVRVVAELEARTGPAAEIAERHGVSRTAPYAWRREIMGDNVGGTEEKGVPVSKEYDDLPDDVGELQDMLREAKMQLRRVQLELDVRQATLEIVKKDPGADPSRLSNAEKAEMVSALRARYKLCEILPIAGMAKSSYEYARSARAKGESGERASARSAVVEAFEASGGTYGYRRIAAVVDAGEWTVRGIMRDEGLVARAAKKRRRYSSYEGEISAAPPQPAARRQGRAPLPRRQPQRAVGHRRHGVPHPGRQGLPVAHSGLLRRHAAELVDLHLAGRRDGQLLAPRGVRVARRGRPPEDPFGQGRPLPLAGMGGDMREERPDQIDVQEGVQPRQR